MNNLNKITSVPATKKDIAIFVNEIKEIILSGEINPLDIDIQLKVIEETVKAIRKENEIKDFVLTEAEKYGKSFEYKGHKLQIKEAGVKYDYSVCNDAEWNATQKDIERLTELKKERESFLKSIKGKLTIVNEETGEVTEINQPVKTSTTTLSITL